MVYAAVTIAAALIFPRLEYRYLAGYRHGMTITAATAVFSSVASGCWRSRVLSFLWPL